MKLTKSLRMLGIVAALIGTTATKSLALPANDLEVTYFSDESFETEVGYLYRGCDGSTHRQGRMSRYGVSQSTPCDSYGGPGEIHCRINLLGGWYETTCPANLCDSGLFACN